MEKKDLLEMRTILDEIDQNMVKFFEKRMQCIEDIIQYKIKHDLPVLDRNRENEIIAKNSLFLEDAKWLPYYEDFIKSILIQSKKYQGSFIDKK